MDLSGINALRVNGETISLRDALQAARLANGTTFLDEQITLALVGQYAREHDIVATDEEFDAALDAYRRNRKLYKADDTTAWLAENRITLEELGDWIEARILTEKAKTHLADIHEDRYFQEHRADFDLAKIRHIVTREEDAAKELLLALEDGAEFFMLALKHSADEHSRPTGGYLGWVDRSRLAAAEEAAVFGAEAGKAVGPFPCDGGFRIIVVEQLRPAALDDRVRQIIRRRLFDEWLQQAVKTASIEVPLFEML